ncbi:unnamed protein product, partial [Amoebophrya sp. A120]|eukprot:GSA120T00000234001.1
MEFVYSEASGRQRDIAELTTAIAPWEASKPEQGDEDYHLWMRKREELKSLLVLGRTKYVESYNERYPFHEPRYLRCSIEQGTVEEAKHCRNDPGFRTSQSSVIADLGKQKLRLDDQLHRGDNKADFAGAEDAAWSVAEFFRKRRRSGGGEEDAKDDISSSSLEIESASRAASATSSRGGTSRRISEDEQEDDKKAGGTKNDEVDVNVNEDGIFGADAVAASLGKMLKTSENSAAARTDAENDE